jgi:hypothetical protein
MEEKSYVPSCTLTISNSHLPHTQPITHHSSLGLGLEEEKLFLKNSMFYGLPPPPPSTATTRALKFAKIIIIVLCEGRVSHKNYMAEPDLKLLLFPIHKFTLHLVYTANTYMLQYVWISR